MTRKRDTGLTWEDRYKARGFARTGLSEATAEVFFDDFASFSQWRGASLTAVTALLDCTGGAIRLWLAVNGTRYYGAGSQGPPMYSARLAKANQPFYYAARIRLPLGAMNPTRYGFLGFFDGGHSIVSGGGVGIPTFFSATTGPGGTPEILPSTIPVDTNWHDLEGWYNGDGRYYFAFDGEAPVSGVPVSPPTDYIVPAIGIYKNGGAGDTQMDVDKGLWLYPQAA